MKTQLAVLALAAVTGLAFTQPVSAALKCPNDPILFPKAPEWVWVLDGKPMPQEPVQEPSAQAKPILTKATVAPFPSWLDKNTVLMIDVKCATEIHRRFGIESQKGGMVIVTRPGAEAALEASLKSVETLQKAYFAKTGKFASQLTDLGWSDRTEYITMLLTVTDRGRRWSAQASHSVLKESSSTSMSAADLKCSLNAAPLFPKADEYVTVLDTKVVSKEKLSELDPKSVESVDIVCAADLHRVFGIESRLGGIVVFTAPGPGTALKGSMDALEALQKAYVAKHNVFAAKLSDLDWTDASGMITVTITLYDDGARWSAVGSHKYLPHSSSNVTAAGHR
jgi:hypothetical protein